jgi:Holliday junction resolvasome RuvABC endonuclease subunit
VIVCGIDPSLSSTGIVFYDTKKKNLYAECVKFEPSKGLEPIIVLALQIEEIIKKHNPKIIAIEEPFVYPGRMQGAMRVFSFHAILRYLIYQNHKKALLYPYWPKSWKKKFTGNGNSDKADVIRVALRKYRYKFSSNDEADAFGLT